VSGPVEGIVTLCIVFAITAVQGGAHFWQQSALASLGIPQLAFIPDYVYQLPFVDWFMVYGGLVLTFNTIQSSLNVISVLRSRGQRSRSALLGLLPFFVTWTLIPIYLLLNPLILHQHLIPFTFYVGLINAYSVGQMISAHLVKAPFPYQNILILPLVVGVIDALGPLLLKLTAKSQGFGEKEVALRGWGWNSVLGNEGAGEVAFVWCCLGLAIGVYGSFVVDVIVSICDYLDIWCLTIKHPWTGEVEAKKAQ
jgi:ethanolaminephosphotransferase